MDQERLAQLERQCIQDRPPACTAACPVHVDARELNAAVARDDFAAAREVLQRTVPFPRIIARCCDAPCQQACVRELAGGGIHINALELAAMRQTEGEAAGAALKPAAKRKAGRVAVIGAGLCGMTAALDLSLKGHDVTVFEAEGRMGGRARDAGEEVMPASELDADCERVPAAGATLLRFTPVALERGAAAGALAALAPGFDAVLLAPGVAEAQCGPALGLEVDARGMIAVDETTLRTSEPGVFAGGGVLRPDQAWSPISSIADGRRAALSIGRLLQKVSLAAARADRDGYESELIVDMEGVECEPPVAAADEGYGYTAAEAVAEASRCLQCECLECVKACAYLEAFGGHPGTYARRIYNNLAVTRGRGSRSANRMIDSCSLCRLCYEVCPTDLDMAEVIRDARREMVRQDRMPASAFSFALRDLELAVSDRFALAAHAPGTDRSEAVLFPGCQLAASDPEHLERVYAHLRERYSPATGLALYCCGAPADWAGQAGVFDATLAGLRDLLGGIGSPRVILACPTCATVFAQHLPEIQTVSLWEVLRETGLPSGAGVIGDGRRVVVHDSCTARYQASFQEPVRDLVRSAGYQIEELELSRERTECCGFGGLMLYANPEMGEAVADRRVSESDTDFVAYCSMCRDRFAARGKRTVHVLDLLFGEDYDARAVRRGPTLTQRAESRMLLKRRLLRDVWRREPDAGEDDWRAALTIEPAVLDLLERRFIRPQEVHQVVAHAEATGRRFAEPGTGRVLASLTIGAVTYWVEYARDDDRLVVHSAYSHRMEIKPPPWAAAETLDEDDGREWRCGLGDHALQPRTVTLSYLVAGVPVKLPACLEHEMVLVGESLATGRMRDVELALEDK